MLKKNYSDIFCGNCGKKGHIYKRCSHPIMSLGIILYRENALVGREYLMICRRNTLGFVEFMRGKYNLENYKYIYDLFSIMTKAERESIVMNNFDTLWNKLWLNKSCKQFFNEFDNSKKKFIKLKEGYKINNNIINFMIINSSVPYKYNTPEWGFPKGRRNIKETDIKCAIREFHEETNIDGSQYIINNKIKPIHEIFFGTNNIRYEHIYYVAKYIGNETDIEIDKNNFNMVSEISDINWFKYKDALRRIRPYNLEKKQLLTKLDKILNTL